MTEDVQWCDKGPVAAAVLGGALMAAAQGVDYADCKTALEDKGYVWLDRPTKLSADDQQRYEAELERWNKARADSIRKK